MIKPKHLYDLTNMGEWQTSAVVLKDGWVWLVRCKCTLSCWLWNMN